MSLSTVAIQPIHNHPALLIECTQRILVLADLHIGIEHELQLAGIRIPSQTRRIVDSIVQLCKTHEPDRLVVLGDVKHTVPQASWQELSEIPRMFRKLLILVDKIDVTPGNHDGKIQQLLPDGVTLHKAYGFSYDNIGFFHGHTWPLEDVIYSRYVLMAHNHPNIEFKDNLGGKTAKPCWLRTRFNLGKLRDRYPRASRTTEFILMPAYIEYGTGVKINDMKPKVLGPMLRNDCVDIYNAKVYLLNGTMFNRVKDLMS
jgi:hypothetical protein